MSETRLSPPWYTYANKIKYSYGCNPCIFVNDLIEKDGDYILTINTLSWDVAEALRQIIPVSESFGNITVEIVVFYPDGSIVPVSNQVYTPELLAKTFCAALSQNRLFIGAVLTEGKVPPLIINSVGNVVLVIKKRIIQFFNDDISDLCSNFNGIAADVFNEVSILEYSPNLKVSFSTSDCDCELQKDFSCRADECS